MKSDANRIANAIATIRANDQFRNDVLSNSVAEIKSQMEKDWYSKTKVYVGFGGSVRKRMSYEIMMNTRDTYDTYYYQLISLSFYPVSRRRQNFFQFFYKIKEYLEF